MPKTILLVDDEVFFTKQLAKNLSDSGYDVFTAFNGQDGIGIAREQSPRMAIVDLKLPDMSGLDVIKSLNELDQPPITIMITAHGYIEAAVSAMKKAGSPRLPAFFMGNGGQTSVSDIWL